VCPRLATAVSRVSVPGELYVLSRAAGSSSRAVASRVRCDDGRHCPVKECSRVCVMRVRGGTTMCMPASAVYHVLWVCSGDLKDKLQVVFAGRGELLVPERPLIFHSKLPVISKGTDFPGKYGSTGVRNIISCSCASDVWRRSIRL
jgi:hypothetical protein